MEKLSRIRGGGCISSLLHALYLSSMVFGASKSYSLSKNRSNKQRPMIPRSQGQKKLHICDRWLRKQKMLHAKGMGSRMNQKKIVGTRENYENVLQKRKE
jgi:hypothetical protein